MRRAEEVVGSKDEVGADVLMTNSEQSWRKMLQHLLHALIITWTYMEPNCSYIIGAQGVVSACHYCEHQKKYINYEFVLFCAVLLREEFQIMATQEVQLRHVV